MATARRGLSPPGGRRLTRRPCHAVHASQRSRLAWRVAVREDSVEISGISAGSHPYRHHCVLPGRGRFGTKPSFPRSLWQRTGRPFAGSILSRAGDHRDEKTRRLSHFDQRIRGAIFMMDSWPEEHGERYKAALQACTGRLPMPQQVEIARQAFLAAAKEAGLVVLDAATCGEGDTPPSRCKAQEPGAD
ncbi:DUF982 domain-containing protein [Mesorhizobium sp. BR1-1-14]|nr:DUF982 domain-containing protein [Mesorhizobium sp. BR1-1-15]MBZ9962067.1 DUF982 domain-containing protein [Mesorhizobium sp. BR1-1-14]